MPKMPDGSVVSSYFNIVDRPTGGDVNNEGLKFAYGQIDKVYYVDDKANISKKYVEYDIDVRDQKGGQSIFRNVRSMASLFSANDFEETVLEPNGFASKGKLDPSNVFANKNGTIVVLAFLHGSRDRPFIIGSFPHDSYIGATKADGIRKKGEFRGFQHEIDKDGNFTITYNGAKKFDGKPADKTVGPTTIRIGKDGTIKTTTGHQIIITNESGKERVQIKTAQKQLFVIDDTKDNESVSLVQKKGAMLNIDKDGSVKLAAANGSYLFLDSKSGAVSLVQAGGNMFSVGPESTLGSSDGKRAFSITDTKVQAFSDQAIAMQAGTKFTLDSGGYTLKDLLLSINVENGKIGIGTPAAELLDLLDQFLTAFLAHNHGTPVGPSSPPVLGAPEVITVKTLLASIKGSV